MYIDGHLKGGFQTVKAYADFCGYFKNWLDAKSNKLLVQRQGEMVAEDYRACLEYVNGEVNHLGIKVLLRWKNQLSFFFTFRKYLRWLLNRPNFL